MRINSWCKLTITAVFIMLLIAISACTSVSTPTASQTQTPSATNQPVEVVSVTGPIPPYNPGGPVVEITLKNMSSEAITSLATSLTLNRDFNFAYDVTLAKPLLPGSSISTSLTLINGGFSDNTTYPLLISGTQQSGETFSYTKQVQVKEP